MSDALRSRLPSCGEIRSRAASIARDTRGRATQLARDLADSETTARASRALERYRDRWERSRLRVDPAMARQLLAVIEEEPVLPGVAGVRTTVFEQQKCKFCLGLHSRKCPAVKVVEYHPDGRVQRVEFFGRWTDADVLWREDLEEAAARGDGDDRAA